MLSEGQIGEHSTSADILDGICESAAFRNSTKSMFVFGRQPHVFWIEGKHRIDWCVHSDPDERAEPVVRRNGARPFNVRGRGKNLPLSVEHRTGQRDKQYKPPPWAVLQGELSDQTAHN